MTLPIGRAQLLDYYLDRVRRAVDDGVTVEDIFNADTVTNAGDRVYPLSIGGSAEIEFLGSRFVNDLPTYTLEAVVADTESTPTELRVRADVLLRQILGALFAEPPDSERVTHQYGRAEPQAVNGPDVVAWQNAYAAIFTVSFSVGVRHQYDDEEVKLG